ncbi:MAG: C10 family peptidase [Bacteroidales bacterium]|nr:C10 family peptidase [Bacteroidales bacterium]
MGRMFVTYCILMLAFAVSNAQQQANVREIREGAVHFINQLYTYKNLSNKSIDTVYTYDDSIGRALLYEVVFNNRHVVLMSGSKACIPVLGYYEAKEGQGILSKRTPIPEGLQDLIDGYIEEIRYCMNNDTVTLFHAAEWGMLLHDSTHNRSLTSVIVAPLLTSTWNQNYPYNYYAPGNNQYTHCAAGCVAVAMGQVMNYWKYPVWRPNRVKQIDWCNMADELDPFESTFEEIDAVAGLLHECGLSVNMVYCDGGYGSSASTQDVRDVLVNRYGYSSDADFQLRFWHNDNTWIGRIKNNLNNSWPVIYKGRSSSTGGSGHSFVCDGYDSDNRFHFNFGWGGSYDGYFTLDNLTPYVYNFNYSQGAIFYIYPSGTQDYCNYTLPLETHYTWYYNLLGFTSPEPYENVPGTFTFLASVPDTLNYPATWRTIPNGAVSEYTAHEEILLQNGFVAEEGSDFYAHIVPCPSCSNRSAQDMASGSPLPLSGYGDMPSQQDSSETSVVEPQVKKHLKVYPNPVSGMLHIELPDSETGIAQITVCNMLGKVMLRKENLSQPELEVTTLPAGMYLLQVRTSDGKRMTAKFVKE